MARKTLDQLRTEAIAAGLRARTAQEKLRARMIDGASRAIPQAVGQYASSRPHRTRYGAVPQGGSAQRFLSDRPRSIMRRESQDLARNSSIARAFIKRGQDAEAGDGAFVTSTTPDEAWNKKADDLFRGWARGEDPALFGHPDARGRRTYWHLIRTVSRCLKTDGDVLKNRIIRDDGTIGIELIESERIVSPGSASPTTLPSGRMLIDGVELDAYGADAVYHVGQWDALGNLRPTTTRLLPPAAVLVTNPMDEAVGMVRGEPALQSIAARIDRLENFIFATGLAAEMAARLALIIKTENPAEFSASLSAATPDQPERTTDLEPQEQDIPAGATMHLRPNETVEQIKGNAPVNNYRDYVLTELAIMAGDIGIPLPWAFFEASGLSWSNIKALLAMASPGLYAWQACLECQCVRPDRLAVLQSFVRAGMLDARDDMHLCEVVFPRVPVLDLQSEVAAHIAAVSQNLETQDQATQNLGNGRAQDINRARARERKQQTDLGIVPAELPGAKPAGGSAAAPDKAATP